MGNCGDPDAVKFRGRGFHQITGLWKYAKYWVYRGWLSPSVMNGWENDPEYKAKNRAGMKIQPPSIDNPQRVTETPYNCLDTAGWELVAGNPEDVFSSIDADANTSIGSKEEKDNISDVTVAINGGDIGGTQRRAYTVALKNIFMDRARLTDSKISELLKANT